jgi:integrase
MRANITTTLLRDLPEGQDMDIRDTKLPGFVLRLRKTGRHSYRVQYGRGKWLHLGRITDLTPLEARAEAKKVVGDAAKGNDPGATRRRAKAGTFGDFLKTVCGPWLTAHRKDGAATLARLQRLTDFATVKLPELSAWQVEKWRTKRLKAGIKPATVNRDMGAIKAALNRAVEWGYLDANPLVRVKPAKVDHQGVLRFLSEDEELRLRDALDRREERQREARESANAWRIERDYPTMPDLRARAFTDRIEPLVLVALNTGLRRGELFNLTWPDVDLTKATLTVRGEGAKSGKTRHVPLNAEALATLAAWKAQGTGSGLVFPGDEGERLDNINSAWRKLCRDAGLVAFRFHDLRHSFASKLVMAGVDLNTVRELLGHGDIKMTLRYAHLAPEHKANAVAKLTAPTRPVQEAVA